MTSETDPGERLRAHGLRVTPQRRAILGSFAGHPAEHLSADEVHARAATDVPEISRGTVYAALAELTELGLLSAHGNPEPVRYESNVDSHQHFRCRGCLRVFDVDIPDPDTRRLADSGFVVDEVTVTAGGTCAECGDYGRGLKAGAKHARGRSSRDLPAGLAAGAVDTPVGKLVVGAGPNGVVRVLFDSHADVPALEATIRARRGGRAARNHVAAATDAVTNFFARLPMEPCVIDWASLGGAETLRATLAAPPAQDTPYDRLDTSAGAKDCGRILGSNPIAILVPCHRITTGRRLPDDYVGGSSLRLALRAFERAV